MPKLPERNCDVCSKSYVPPRERSFYCSRSCQVTGKNRKNKRPPVTLVCVNCKKNFVVPYSLRNLRETCGRSCGVALGMSRVDKKAFGRSISDARRAGIASGEIVVVGKPHTEETKRHLSEKAKIRMGNRETNPFVGKKRSLESREKQSKTRAERIIAGEYGGWFKKGSIETKKSGLVNFRSSWEENVIKNLDADPNVVAFKVEPLCLPYYLAEGKEQHLRHYIPDFIVKYADGRCVMMEVKPRFFVDATINVAKFSVAKEYCEMNGLEFRVLTQSDPEVST